jgi:hypothetical protein
MLLQLPLGILYFTMTTVAVSVSTWLVAAPFLQVLLDTPVARSMDWAYYIEPWAMPVAVVLGLLGFVVTLWMVRGIGLLHGQYAKALLVGRVDQAPAAPAAPASSEPVPPLTAGTPAPPAPPAPPAGGSTEGNAS